MFVLADMVKETSAPAIASLKRLGLRVYMLTGDNNASAARVAEEVGATGFKAEMLPADKEKYILDMQHRGRIVAMAGLLCVGTCRCIDSHGQRNRYCN